MRRSSRTPSAPSAHFWRARAGCVEGDLVEGFLPMGQCAAVIDRVLPAARSSSDSRGAAVTVATATPRRATCRSRSRTASARRPGGHRPKIALQEGERTLSYAQLVERVDRVANGTSNGLGLRRGRARRRSLRRTASSSWTSCSGSPPPASRRRWSTRARRRPSWRTSATTAPPACSSCTPRSQSLRDRPTSRPCSRDRRLGDELRGVARPELARAPHAGTEEWDTFCIPYTAGTTGNAEGRARFRIDPRALTFFAMGSEFGCYGARMTARSAIAPLFHGAGFAFAVAPIFFGGYCAILPEVRSGGRATASRRSGDHERFHGADPLQRPVRPRRRRPRSPPSDLAADSDLERGPAVAVDEGAHCRPLRRRCAVRVLRLDRGKHRLRSRAGRSAEKAAVRRAPVRLYGGPATRRGGAGRPRGRGRRALQPVAVSLQRVLEAVRGHGTRDSGTDSSAPGISPGKTRRATSTSSTARTT